MIYHTAGTKNFNLFVHQSYQVSSIILPVLMTRKLRNKDVKNTFPEPQSYEEAKAFTWTPAARFQAAQSDRPSCHDWNVL